MEQRVRQSRTDRLILKFRLLGPPRLSHLKHPTDEVALAIYLVKDMVQNGSFLSTLTI